MSAQYQSLNGSGVQQTMYEFKVQQRIVKDYLHLVSDGRSLVLQEAGTEILRFACRRFIRDH